MDSETAVKKSLKDNSPHPIFNVTENNPISHENGNDDAEISIFEAHKYFSEESNESKLPSHDLISLHQRPPSSSISPVDGYVKTKAFRTTPAASSEASWNSRIGLLTSTGDRARKRLSAAKKWFLRRNCCCINEKSVLVHEEAGPIMLIDAKKSSSEMDQKLNQTTSESLTKCSISESVVEIHHIKAMAPNPAAASSSIDVPCQQRITAKGRPFIDGAVGFTFPILTSSSSSSDNNPLEKIFLEALPPPPPRRTSSMGSPVGREDDGASDASSDLFEIESLSTLTSGPIHCWWDSVDELSNSERKSAAAVRPSNAENHECKACGAIATDGCGRGSSVELSVSATEVSIAALWPLLEEGGEGKTKGNGSMVMSCREEKKTAAAKCIAEGPAAIPLHVGGSPPRGSSHAPPLRMAFVA